MSRVDKPALLRQFFELGVLYSGRVLSFNKMLGQLQDAGNTTTLSHYKDLLSAAGLLTGLQKYAATPVRRKASSPKLQVMNTALMSALARLESNEVRKNPPENSGDRRIRGTAYVIHLIPLANRLKRSYCKSVSIGIAEDGWLKRFFRESFINHPFAWRRVLRISFSSFTSRSNSAAFHRRALPIL